MPYRMKSGNWRGCKMVNGNRLTKVFFTKADAKAWESSIAVEENRKKTYLPFVTATDLDTIRKDFKELASNPYNTVADIFDSAMEVLQLHFRFKDVMSLAKAKKDNEYIRPKLRMEVLDRDKSTCQICGAQAPEVKLELDHIIPRIRGGLTELRNLRVLCKTCNLGKSDSNMGKILLKMNGD